jgi:hypothetical protein
MTPRRPAVTAIIRVDARFARELRRAARKQRITIVQLTRTLTDKGSLSAMILPLFLDPTGETTP